MEITNTRDVAISGNATLSVVRRDQYNQTINAQVVHIGRSQRAMGKQEQKKRDSDPEYKQYREIIRGDIYKVEELVENIWDCEWKDDGLHVWSCRRTVHQARLYGDGKVFTAFSYHGADALKAWKKDFVKYSRTNDPAILFQLFGINRSKVPALLFYDGAKTGYPWVICSGKNRFGRDFTWSYTLMLGRGKDKTGAGSLDLDILQYANAHSCETTTEDLLGVQDLGIQFSWKEFIPNGPLLCSSPDRIPCDEVRDSIGSICLDTVYSGLGKIALLKRGIADSWRKFTSGNAVCNMTRIEGGWTRFQFDTKVFGWTGDSLLLSIDGDRVAWLSQAHRFSEVFTGGSDCFVPHLAIYLYIGPRLGQSGVSAPETPPIVYLFIRPSPHHVRVTDLESWINQIAFWSFDENGTTEISEAECESLYLPNITVDCVEVKIRKWPKSVYDAIYMWQVARGFDPTVVKQNTRSEEIEVVEQMEPSTAPDLFVMPDSTSDKVVAGEIALPKYQRKFLLNGAL
uniref:Uncharacterized protein n=1 Tax=Moniliophthora roreri TaxID=221103 RepID=A0A0W0F2I8_MONRR